MDDITEAIGQLSTTAKEWKPSSQRSNQPPQQTPQSPTSPNRTSSLRPAPVGNPSGIREFVPGAGPAVKEFVPGSGWNTEAPGAASWEPSSPQQASAYSNDNVIPEKPEPSTVPSGPAPPPPMRTLHSMAVHDELWRHSRGIAMESMREMDPADPRHKAVPPPFSNAHQLDEANPRNSRSSFGYPTSVFKVINREDGHLYCLRRMDNVRSVSNKIAVAVTDRWVGASTTSTPVVSHPGVVRFHRVFVANRAVFFVHQYIPGARTLQEQFLRSPLPEAVLWSWTTQLVSAIRTVHAGNLACRTLQANHILCETADGTWGSSGGRVRLRINCLGMVDALEFEARKQLRDLQLEDMRDLGRIILSLATGTEITRASDNNTLRQCDAFVRQHYSAEVINLVLSLLAPNSTIPSIFDVSRLIADHAFDELDFTQTVSDKTSAALAVEYDSGRALRLLLKLGFINERPEFGINRRWSESGDCYVLKLFRDYVFHQADGGGRPVMDLGHVVTALNKLDASDQEKIVLSSRDGKTLMVVSYADVARCLDNAFEELCNGAVPPAALQY